MSKPRIITFDTEFCNLNANFGYLICGSWKVFGEKKIRSVISYKPWEDKKIVKKLCEVLTEADLIVTWYGTYCDLPYIQSRLLYHNLHPMPPVPHVDGWWIARKKMRLHSNRLDSVAGFLGLPQKVPVTTRQWTEAYMGKRSAIDYLKVRCEQDVKLTEQVYERIRPLLTTHPNLSLTVGAQTCPTCGTKDKLQRQGSRIARTRTVQRYQCQACGGWSQGKSEKVKGVVIR